MYYLALSLAIAILFSQTVHTYIVFQSFSIVEDAILRTIQAIMFCGIISVGILYFVLVGKPELALLGALIESIINVYYYSEDFWKNGFIKRTGDDAKKKHRNDVKTWWRRNWLPMFFSVLLPVMIFIFSEEIRLQR